MFNTPLELWAPKEIALFEACISRFGKNFYQFSNFVSLSYGKSVLA